jgi:hypothetical protein
MQLKVGETYNFFKNIEDWWIVKVLEIQDDRYYVEVLKRVGNQQYRRSQKVLSVSQRNVYYLRNNKIS